MALRDMSMCRGCLKKMIEIDRLKEAIRGLKKQNHELREKLNCANRHINEKPFGSSTPSSKELLKPSSDPSKQAKKGGARRGHKGYGRRKRPDRPRLHDKVVPAPTLCPYCGGPLAKPSRRRRELLNWRLAPPAVQPVIHEDCWCSHCRLTVRSPTPGALPGMLLDNQALATVAQLHYMQGMTIGTLARITGINKGTLIGAMHRLAEVLQPALPVLCEELASCSVIFADETGWRNDGRNGYAWMIRSFDTIAYRFCDTRAGTVPVELLGSDPLPGVLLTDRYAGYNRLDISRQYCYAHLLRDLQDIGKQFPDDPEVNGFIEALAPKLAQAMSLRDRKRTIQGYLAEAGELKEQILEIVNSPAKHAAVQTFQDIFRRNAERLYQWVEDPIIPPDNNMAERSLRPTVIARKISFGSQSDRGARTRSVIMSVLGTLKLRTHDPWLVLTGALDTFARQPDRTAQIADILFNEPTPTSV